MKRPPITNPIVLYNEPEPLKQVLDMGSLAELSNLLGRTNTTPIVTNPKEFIWDDISRRFIQ